jgi:hypothetical protein
VGRLIDFRLLVEVLSDSDWEHLAQKNCSLYDLEIKGEERARVTFTYRDTPPRIKTSHKAPLPKDSTTSPEYYP